MITTMYSAPAADGASGKQVAQVALLSNNRFKLGIGVGWNEVEYVGLNENSRRRETPKRANRPYAATWSEPWTNMANIMCR